MIKTQTLVACVTLHMAVINRLEEEELVNGKQNLNSTKPRRKRDHRPYMIHDLGRSYLLIEKSLDYKLEYPPSSTFWSIYGHFWLQDFKMLVDKTMVDTSSETLAKMQPRLYL